MCKRIENILTFSVQAEEQGQRLDRFLAVRASDLSRARIKQLIDQGLALVDGTPTKASRKVAAGQSITLSLPPVSPAELAPDPGVAFEVLYQDAHLLVVNKPPGVVVHPAAGHQEGTLVHGLLAVCSDLSGVGGQARPGIVHRLDKDTSGLMIVAKHDAAHSALAEAFKSRQVTKIYLAICRGRPDRMQGEINAPIGRHPIRRKEMSIRSTAARPALTRWQVLQELSGGLSLLKLNLLTGRTHQIRVHLASIGCPVLGDKVYGKGRTPFQGRTGAGLRSLVKRQMLHAHQLLLQHPITGRTLEFTAPLPHDMQRVLSEVT